MQEGPVPVTVTVNDGKGGTASDTVTIQVVRPAGEGVHVRGRALRLRPLHAAARSDARARRGDQGAAGRTRSCASRSKATPATSARPNTTSRSASVAPTRCATTCSAAASAPTGCAPSATARSGRSTTTPRRNAPAQPPRRAGRPRAVANAAELASGARGRLRRFCPFAPLRSSDPWSSRPRPRPRSDALIAALDRLERRRARGGHRAARASSARARSTRLIAVVRQIRRSPRRRIAHRSRALEAHRRSTRAGAVRAAGARRRRRRRGRRGRRRCERCSTSSRETRPPTARSTPCVALTLDAGNDRRRQARGLRCAGGHAVERCARAGRRGVRRRAALQRTARGVRSEAAVERVAGRRAGRPLPDDPSSCGSAAAAGDRRR